MAIFNLPVMTLSDRTAPVISGTSVGNPIALDENVATSSLVATVTDDGTAVSFAIVSGDPNSDFHIANNGDITVFNSPDYEATPSYSLGITATDSLGNTSAPFTVTININDLDDVAPIVSLTSQTLNGIDEDNNGQLIASFSVTDNGVPVTSGVTLTGSPSATNFDLNYISGSQWDLVSASSGRLGGGVPTNQTFTFTVTYTDAAGNPGSAQCILVVNDVDAPILSATEITQNVSEKPTSNITLVEFGATARDGSNVSQNLTFSVSPSGSGFSSTYNSSTGKMEVFAQSGSTLGGGVDRNTTFTITATGSVAGSSSSISRSITVEDKSTITGGVQIGGPTASQLATFENTNMSQYWDAMTVAGSTLLLFDFDNYANGAWETTYVLQVALSSGQFRRGGSPEVLTMPSIASGQLGSLSSHRSIEHVWSNSTYIYGLSDNDNNNSPCLWRAGSSQTGTWTLLGQVSNWTDDAGFNDGDQSFSVGNAAYVFQREVNGEARYIKITGWGPNSAGSVAATDLPINGLDEDALGNGVAVCDGPSPTLLIAGDRYPHVDIVEHSSGNTKVGDHVTTDDWDNLEDQISGGASLRIGSGDALVGSGNYMYVFNESHLHPNDYMLYRFDVSNAAGPE